MEQLAAFVSSRGILRSCGTHNRKPASSQPLLDADLLDRHRPGGSIYVCTDAVVPFAQSVLPLIQKPFVLVSGDSDMPVGRAMTEAPAVATLLASELLLGWHAQNLSADHPKLHPLPIGLDYHTMWERPGLWGLTAVSAIAQENALLNTLAASPEFQYRYMAAYCNWHFAIGRGDRQACHDQVDKSVCFFEPAAIPRQSSWSRQSECMFVVSPEGAGMDCHRTWEALLLGCIPIVKRNPLVRLFEGLPVLIVDAWEQVNRNVLLEFARTLPDRRFDYSPLFRDYWVRRIAGNPAPVLDSMSHSDFRRVVTRRTG